MEFNSIVFPAPKPSYHEKMRNLIWIPAQPNGKMPGVQSKEPDISHVSSGLALNASNTNLAQVAHGLDKVKRRPAADGQHSSSQERYIPCLYLPYKDGCDKIMIYFHGNAEDLGCSYDFCDQIRKFL